MAQECGRDQVGTAILASGSTARQMVMEFIRGLMATGTKVNLNAA